MNPIKKLAKDTAIYGVSSIIGRFLNWWLVPYYSFIFVPVMLYFGQRKTRRIYET